MESSLSLSYHSLRVSYSSPDVVEKSLSTHNATIVHISKLPKCRSPNWTKRCRKRRHFPRRHFDFNRPHRSLPSVGRSISAIREITLSSKATQTEIEQTGVNPASKDVKEFVNQCSQCDVLDWYKFTNAKIGQLANELEAVRKAWLFDKTKLARRASAMATSLHDHRLTNRRLTMENDSKTDTIRTLSSLLMKSEACNASRLAAMKSLKDEMAAFRKTMSDVSESSDQLRQQNADLVSENRRYKKTLANLYDKLRQLRESSDEWEQVIGSYIEILVLEAEDNHEDCRLETSHQLGHLKASYDHKIRWLLTKLFRADQKTEELYRTVEKILKGAHFKRHSSSLQWLNPDMSEGCVRPGEAYEAVLGLTEYLAACQWLSFQKRFSSNLSELVTSVIGDIDEMPEIPEDDSPNTSNNTCT